METILIRNVRAADSLRDAVCDMLLKDGRIAESGTHESLKDAGGLYAGMWAEYNTAAQWKIQKESL